MRGKPGFSPGEREPVQAEAPCLADMQRLCMET